MSATRVAAIYVAAVVGAAVSSPSHAREVPLNLSAPSAPAATSPSGQAPTTGPASEEAVVTEAFGIHGQFTNVTQYHPPFTSPFYGTNSLVPGHRGNETTDLTLFAGLRLWDGLEAYVNPEVDQGFGLSNTLGVAGFPSGEAYKVGKSEPYFRLQRLFFRQRFDLGGESETVESDANQIAGMRTANNLIVTIGKFTVTDIFDANAYAHDPKVDFLNWAV